MSRSEPNVSVHSWNGKLLVTRGEARSERWLKGLEEQRGAGLGQRDETQLIDDKKFIAGQTESI